MCNSFQRSVGTGPCHQVNTRTTPGCAYNRLHRARSRAQHLPDQWALPTATETGANWRTESCRAAWHSRTVHEQRRGRNSTAIREQLSTVQRTIRGALPRPFIQARGAGFLSPDLRAKQSESA